MNWSFSFGRRPLAGGILLRNDQVRVAYHLADCINIIEGRKQLFLDVCADILSLSFELLEISRKVWVVRKQV